MPKSSDLYFLSQKIALRFAPEAEKFLKGYTSNTLDSSENAFVDIQGRVIAVFRQKFISSDEIIVILEKAFEERLREHLKKYLQLFNTRIENLPVRVYHDLSKDEFILANEEMPAAVTEEAYRLFRLKNQIPVQGIDFDQTLILNVANEKWVSYTKGCYLGQEIIARVHYKGKPPKALVVKSEDECTPDERARMTSKTLDPSTGKTLGFVFVDSL